MPEQWVVNASPLIVLGKVGQLDLLAKLSQRTVVPAAVVSEIIAGPERDAARLAVQAKWYEKDEAAISDVLAAVRRHLYSC